MDSAKKKKIKEPIAIVGMSCRLPGNVESPAALWQALKEEQDLITAIGNDRWAVDNYYHPNEKEAGKSYSFAAGLLSRIDEFDANFFNISPREARQMDPRQRLLLETTWEALEQGGQVPAHLEGTHCGVYVGLSGNDYSLAFGNDPAMIETHTMTGNACSIASNRLSYFLGLKGPSMSVDTACSSALVALHLACQAIWNKEIPDAIAACSSMHMHPLPFVGFSKAQMISQEGHCKAFDDSADGYVRSEGCVVLYLKPLSEAEKNRDNIQALIVNTGVNSDGKTSSLPVPSQEAQTDLLLQVHKEVGVKPEELAYLEAHGTGTQVGDPIEAHALGEAIGKKRKTPLPIGSVKTNIGHLEVASGMAGLLKVVLSLQHKAIPASLHFNKPNAHIDFATLNLQVVNQYKPLATDNKPLFMGVNCFGFGGANSHVLLKNHVKKKSFVKSKMTPPLFFSAKEPTALKAVVEKYENCISEKNYYEVAYNLAYKRQALDYGLAIYGKDFTEVKTRISAYLADKQDVACAITTKHFAHNQKIALVYAGNGSQWAGMGQQLLHASSSFRKSVEEVDAIFSTLADFSLVSELQKEEKENRLHLTEVAQPLLFAIQVGLTHFLWEKKVDISAVIGHSVGEVAASWASGAISLEQAVNIIFARSTVQGTTKGQGKMAAVSMSYDALLSLIEEHKLSVEIVTINSPNGLTVAGTVTALTKLQKYCDEQSVYCRILDLDYAFHSHHMKALKAPFYHLIDSVESQKTTCQFISTVTGTVLEGKALTEDYWWKNIASPVQFHQAINTAIEQGMGIFIEISPHAIMASYIKEALQQQEKKANVLHTLKRDTNDVESLNKLVYEVVLAGGQIDKAQWFPKKADIIDLPTYPWQRKSYWHKHTVENQNHCQFKKEHPLLGTRIRQHETIWENQLDSESLPWLNDHIVNDTCVMPAAALMEMALAASKLIHEGTQHEVIEFEIHLPVIFEKGKARLLRFEYYASDHSFVIKSKDRLSNDAFSQHAVGRLVGKPAIEQEKCALDLKNYNYFVAGKEHYKLAHQIGLNYGPLFQGIKNVWVWDNKAVAEVIVTEEVDALAKKYNVFPGLLDCCFQPLISGAMEDILADDYDVYLPIRTESICLLGDIKKAAFYCVDFKTRGKSSVLLESKLVDAEGRVLMMLRGNRLKKVVFATTNQQQSFVDTTTELKASCYPTTFMDIDNLSKQQQWLNSHGQSREKHFSEILPLMHTLIIQYIYEGLFVFFNGKSFALAQENIPKTKQAYFAWCVQILLQEKLLTEKNGQYQFVKDDSRYGAELLWHAMVGDYPSYISELLQIGRVGQALPELLKNGKIILPSQSTQSHLVTKAPSIVGRYDLLVEAVKRVLTYWPKERRFSLLQVGASCITEKLLPLFGGADGDYVITDSNEETLASLEAQFKSHCFVTTKRCCWSAQEPPTFLETYDFVIVALHLHQKKEIAYCLTQLKKCLKTDGVLFLAERTPNHFDDFTQGLDPTWWRYQSHGRRTGQLLPAKLWQQLLVENGFVCVEPLYEKSDIECASDFVLLAQSLHAKEKPQLKDEKTSFLVITDDEKNKKTLWADTKGKTFTFLLVDAHFSVDKEMRINQTIDEVLSNGVFDKVIFLLGLNKEQEDKAPLAYQNRLSTVLYFVQAFKAKQQTNLCFVTRGAALINQAQDSFPWQSSLWGFVRVLMNEIPELKAQLFDLQGEDLKTLAINLLQAIMLSEKQNENEWVITDKAIHTIRFIPAKLNQAHNNETDNVYLDFTEAGRLGNLAWFALKTKPLTKDMVRIKPMAAGLNFRDVMYTMRMISDEALEQGYLGATLGMEYAGVITAVGKNVKHLKVGDRVMGFAPQSFSTAISIKAETVIPLPEEWSFNEAATVPAAFFTVYYALKQLAQVVEGERILIHGAAGGVGIAAIQLAHYLGATVYATAGSEEKREFLQLMGVQYVYDSRSLAFKEQVMRDTDGKGVDVVLNSLAGEAILANFHLLRPFGRFLELGKRDFYENSKIGLRPFRNNISYFGIDADQLMVERPDLTLRLFKEMMQLFKEGELKPLPFRVFKGIDAANAFRYMQKSQQIGKIVLDLNECPKAALTDKKARLQLKTDASYLITGGVKGFGLKTAEFFVACGAKELILVSRSGHLEEDSKTVIKRMQKQGVTVHLRAVDVTDEKAVKLLIDEFAASLKGVIHSAVVFDDHLIKNLTEASIEKVLAPKIAGGWYLHQATKKLSLDYFIVYSSATTLIGNPGQANYVAANAYLESLIRLRRKEKLKGQFIAWGAIDDVGFLSRHQKIKNMLESSTGSKAIHSSDALTYLEKFMLSGEPGLSLMDFNLTKIKNLLPNVNKDKFKRLLQLEVGLDEVLHDDIQVMIRGRSQEEVNALIVETLSLEVAQILCISPKLIDVNQSLTNMGMDSLMGVELARAVEARFKVNLPMMSLTQGTSIYAIASKVVAALCDEEKNNALTEDSELKMVMQGVAKHGEDKRMSEDEAKALLKELNEKVEREESFI